MANGILIAPKLGAEELTLVARQIAKIYRRVIALREARPPQPMRVLTFDEICSTPLRSRLESADDDISGLEYAAWSIGLAVLAMGGHDAMHAVFALFEDIEPSGRASSWLDHRWNGVSDGTFVWSS